MAKELPYFRFTAHEWLNDDISLEDYTLKGVFIDVCAYYWSQDCNVTLTKLKKRFNNATNYINELIKSDVLKHENRHDCISIVFLDKQYNLLSEKRKVLQLNGSKGGKAKANATKLLEQKPSYKDKDNNNNKDNNGIDIEKEFLNSQKWSEDICRNYKLSPMFVKNQMLKFVEEQKLISDINKRTIEDFRKHFINIIKKIQPTTEEIKPKIKW